MQGRKSLTLFENHSKCLILQNCVRSYSEVGFVRHFLVILKHCVAVVLNFRMTKRVVTALRMTSYFRW